VERMFSGNSYKQSNKFSFSTKGREYLYYFLKDLLHGGTMCQYA
jgi:hypothetical protein